MIKLTIPKDIVPWENDVEVNITKNILEREWWLLLYEHLGYNVYFIYGPTDSNCICPVFLCDKNYIFKFIESLEGIDKPYPEIMLQNLESII